MIDARIRLCFHLSSTKSIRFYRAFKNKISVEQHLSNLIFVSILKYVVNLALSQRSMRGRVTIFHIIVN